MTNSFRTFLMAAICLIAFTVSARAATVTLTWDPNTDGDAVGYLVSYGASSQHYERTIDVGSSTLYPIADLDPGQIYYFAVQAYDSAGRVSGFSAEVVLSPVVAPPDPVPPAPDPVPPVPAPAGLSLTSLTANLVAPQDAGVSVGFAASVSGGVKPYEFQWLVFDGTIWTVAEDWSLNSNFVWTPARANANYRVGVTVRSSATEADPADSSTAGGSIPFPIMNPPPGRGNEHRRFPPHPHESGKK
jgi:hypothetical protein